MVTMNKRWIIFRLLPTATGVLLLSMLLTVAYSKRASGQTALPEPAQGPAQGTEQEDSVYLYGFFKDVSDPSGCGELANRVSSLALRPTVLLSIERGPEFLLDLPGGDELMACAVKAFQDSGHAVKALFLQDTVYLTNTAEALRRAAKLNEFIVRHPGSFAGAQADIEPYVTEDWSCGDVHDRRNIFATLRDLLGQVREQMPGVPLGVAVGWWTPATADDYPEAAPESLLKVADELYLMVYGDEGGPVVAGSAARILSRINSPEYFSARGRVIVAMGTYEYRSPQDLQTELEKVNRALAFRPHFAGTSVFHAQSVFDAPLVRLVSGQVTDQSGRFVPGVEIESDGMRDTSNRCGKFGLRGTSLLQGELTLRKAGYKTLKMPFQVRRLGVEKELGQVVLQKEN